MLNMKNKEIFICEVEFKYSIQLGVKSKDISSLCVMCIYVSLKFSLGPAIFNTKHKILVFVSFKLTILSDKSS